MPSSKVLVVIGLLALCAIVIATINTPSLANSEELRVFEEGNVTFIPIHQRGDLEENMAVISANFALWEEAHPDREIVCFQIDSRPSSYGVRGAFVNGIFLYSREK